MNQGFYYKRQSQNIFKKGIDIQSNIVYNRGIKAREENKMFHYFTLEEVYAYAEKKGFKREDVEIEKIDGEVHGTYYEVSFGSQWYQLWTWEFERLDRPAVDYYYEECEA